MTVTPVKSTEDPRVKRTRQLLQQAFVALLSERDFAAITVQDIAKEATVNRATFYAHYSDKFDLADSLAREWLRQRLATSVPDVSPITVVTLETLCLTVFDFLGEVFGRCKLDRQLGPLLEGALHEVLSGFIVDWLNRTASDSQSSRPDPGITAQIISSAFIGAGLRWVRQDRTQSAAGLARQIVYVLAPGVLAAHESLKPGHRRPTRLVRS